MIDFFLAGPSLLQEMPDFLNLIQHQHYHIRLPVRQRKNK